MTGDGRLRVALVADDHELFRAGAAAMLTRHCDYEAVLQAGSFPEAVAILEAEPSVSLACFDLGMPGVGDPTSLKQIRQRFPEIRLVVMTGSERRDTILLALQSGVHGYVPKTLPMAEMVQAFGIVTEGGIYVPQQLAVLPSHGRDTVPEQPVGGWAAASSPTGHRPAAELTPRQDEILRLIRTGRSNKEIGLRLGLTENTVKVHANALYRKLGIHSRQQASELRLGPVPHDGGRPPIPNGTDAFSPNRDGDRGDEPGPGRARD